MKTNSAFLFLILLFFYFKASAQVSVSPANVYVLDSSLTPSPLLMERLSYYKFILVGEMHGTAQPVNFMKQVALALSKNKQVKVGFEIKQDEIYLANQTINPADLKKTKFFKENDKGMSSTAWFNAILELSKIKNISLFFFDKNKAQDNIDRDSAMFLNIKENYLKDTNSIIITISGNVHNQPKPYKNSKTMGYFISTWLSGSILSVNHLYESGTMYNAVNDKLKERKIGTDQSVLKSISSTPDYFYFDPDHEFSQLWNSFLFTTKINASFPVKNK